MERQPCVYILASRRNGTRYVGATSNLLGRLHQHRTKAIPGFTARYDVTRLVWYEMTDRIDSAITRERQLKAWRRDWKVALIERDNPYWEDRAITLGFSPLPSS